MKNTHIIVSAAFLAIAMTSHAAVSALGFTGGTGTSSYDQYAGIAGSGWDSAWAIGGSSVAGNVSVSSTTPVNGGGTYLSVTNTNTTTDATLYRSFDGTATGQLVTAPYQVSYTLRIDSLTGFNNSNDYISLADNNTIGGAGTASTFLIRAFGAATGTANSGVWAFHDGLLDGSATNTTYSTSNFVSTTMPVAAGTTYTFTIDVDAASRTYDVSIHNGSTTVTGTNLGFRTNLFAGGDYLNFVTRNHSTSDTITYSLDNVSIVPEPAAATLFGGLATLILLRRRRA